MFTRAVTSSAGFGVAALVRIGKTEGLCSLEDPASPPHLNSVRSVILLESLALCWLTGLVSEAALTQERTVNGLFLEPLNYGRRVQVSEV